MPLRIKYKEPEYVFYELSVHNRNSGNGIDVQLVDEYNNTLRKLISLKMEVDGRIYVLEELKRIS